MTGIRSARRIRLLRKPFPDLERVLALFVAQQSTAEAGRRVLVGQIDGEVAKSQRFINLAGMFLRSG